jgi:BirA family biotin operon repressor/biotin-[acetyl-CoA-carboxylase] ligase
VRILNDNATLVVSGSKIASDLGTSRSEVWRLVQQLRSLGLQIAGHPATGYRLEAVPDLLLPAVLEPLITGTIFSGRISHFFRIGSTNAVALEAAQKGESEGAVFISEEQTAGRGRGGHKWHSDRLGGIYISVLLRPAMAPADAVALSLMTGLATACAVKEVTGTTSDLRWPNDLLLARGESDRKFGGILIELNAEITRIRHAVIGIGINVNQESFPPDIADVATSLRLGTGRCWSRVDLTAALLRSLDREYRQLQSAPNAQVALQSRFEKASSYARGRQVQVDENAGYTGVTEGLDTRGFLLVRTDDGNLRTVLSGGVRGIDKV